jgi:hypothetical protein
MLDLSSCSGELPAVHPASHRSVDHDVEGRHSGLGCSMNVSK